MKPELSPIETQEDLLRAITALEQSRAEAALALEERTTDMIEGFRPVNLLKGAVRDITGSGGLTQRLLAMGVGMAAGRIARFIYQGRSRNPVKELIGSLLQAGITTYVSSKPETVQRIGGKAIRAIRLALVEHEEQE